MTNTDQHTTATTRDDLNTIAEYKRRPLNQARAILDIASASTDHKRAYLAGVGSPYATTTEDAIADAAFNGHVLNALASLANAYEQEISNG